MNVAQWKREWVLLVQESGEFLRTYLPHTTDNMLIEFSFHIDEICRSIANTTNIGVMVAYK